VVVGPQHSEQAEDDIVRTIQIIKIPEIFHVCQESRLAALGIYELFSIDSAYSTYINWEKDVVYLPKLADLFGEKDIDDVILPVRKLKAKSRYFEISQKCQQLALNREDLGFFGKNIYIPGRQFAVVEGLSMVFSNGKSSTFMEGMFLPLYEKGPVQKQWKVAVQHEHCDKAWAYTFPLPVENEMTEDEKHEAIQKQQAADYAMRVEWEARQRYVRDLILATA
jgi:hypothetical protein